MLLRLLVPLFAFLLSSSTSSTLLSQSTNPAESLFEHKTDIPLHVLDGETVTQGVRAAELCDYDNDGQVDLVYATDNLLHVYHGTGQTNGPDGPVFSTGLSQSFRITDKKEATAVPLRVVCFRRSEAQLAKLNRVSRPRSWTQVYVATGYGTYASTGEPETIVEVWAIGAAPGGLSVKVTGRKVSQLRVGSDWKALAAMVSIADLDRDGVEDVLIGGHFFYQSVFPGMDNREIHLKMLWPGLVVVKTMVTDLSLGEYVDVLAEIRSPQDASVTQVRWLSVQTRGQFFGESRVICSFPDASLSPQAVVDVNADGLPDIVFIISRERIGYCIGQTNTAGGFSYDIMQLSPFTGDTRVMRMSQTEWVVPADFLLTRRFSAFTVGGCDSLSQPVFVSIPAPGSFTAIPLLPHVNNTAPIMCRLPPLVGDLNRDGSWDVLVVHHRPVSEPSQPSYKEPVFFSWYKNTGVFSSQHEATVLDSHWAVPLSATAADATATFLVTVVVTRPVSMRWVVLPATVAAPTGRDILEGHTALEGHLPSGMQGFVDGHIYAPCSQVAVLVTDVVDSTRYAFYYALSDPNEPSPRVRTLHFTQPARAGIPPLLAAIGLSGGGLEGRFSSTKMDYQVTLLQTSGFLRMELYGPTDSTITIRFSWQNAQTTLSGFGTALVRIPTTAHVRDMSVSVEVSHPSKGENSTYTIRLWRFIPLWPSEVYLGSASERLAAKRGSTLFREEFVMLDWNATAAMSCVPGFAQYSLHVLMGAPRSNFLLLDFADITTQQCRRISKLGTLILTRSVAAFHRRFHVPFEAEVLEFANYPSMDGKLSYTGALLVLMLDATVHWSLPLEPCSTPQCDELLDQGHSLVGSVQGTSLIWTASPVPGSSLPAATRFHDVSVAAPAWPSQCHAVSATALWLERGRNDVLFCAMGDFDADGGTSVQCGAAKPCPGDERHAVASVTHSALLSVANASAVPAASLLLVPMFAHLRASSTRKSVVFPLHLAAPCMPWYDVVSVPPRVLQHTCGSSEDAIHLSPLEMHAVLTTRTRQSGGLDRRVDDLLIVTRSASVRLFVNVDGEGFFEERSVSGVSANRPESIALVDVESSGTPALVFASAANPDRVAVWLSVATQPAYEEEARLVSHYDACDTVVLVSPITDSAGFVWTCESSLGRTLLLVTQFSETKAGSGVVRAHVDVLSLPSTLDGKQPWTDISFALVGRVIGRKTIAQAQVGADVLIGAHGRLFAMRTVDVDMPLGQRSLGPPRQVGTLSASSPPNRALLQPSRYDVHPIDDLVLSGSVVKNSEVNWASKVIHTSHGTVRRLFRTESSSICLIERSQLHNFDSPTTNLLCGKWEVSSPTGQPRMRLPELITPLPLDPEIVVTHAFGSTSSDDFVVADGQAAYVVLGHGGQAQIPVGSVAGHLLIVDMFLSRRFLDDGSPNPTPTADVDLVAVVIMRNEDSGSPETVLMWLPNTRTPVRFVAPVRLDSQGLHFQADNLVQMKTSPDYTVLIVLMNNVRSPTHIKPHTAFVVCLRRGARIDVDYGATVDWLPDVGPEGPGLFEVAPLLNARTTSALVADVVVTRVHDGSTSIFVFPGHGTSIQNFALQDVGYLLTVRGNITSLRVEDVNGDAISDLVWTATGSDGTSWTAWSQQVSDQVFSSERLLGQMQPPTDDPSQRCRAAVVFDEGNAAASVATLCGSRVATLAPIDAGQLQAIDSTSELLCEAPVLHVGGNTSCVFVPRWKGQHTSLHYWPRIGLFGDSQIGWLSEPSIERDGTPPLTVDSSAAVRFQYYAPTSEEYDHSTSSARGGFVQLALEKPQTDDTVMFQINVQDDPDSTSTFVCGTPRVRLGSTISCKLVFRKNNLPVFSAFQCLELEVSDSSLSVLSAVVSEQGGQGSTVEVTVLAGSEAIQEATVSCIGGAEHGLPSAQFSVTPVKSCTTQLRQPQLVHFTAGGRVGVRVDMRMGASASVNVVRAFTPKLVEWANNPLSTVKFAPANGQVQLFCTDWNMTAAPYDEHARSLVIEVDCTLMRGRGPSLVPFVRLPLLSMVCSAAADAQPLRFPPPRIVPHSLRLNSSQAGVDEGHGTVYLTSVEPNQLLLDVQYSSLVPDNVVVTYGGEPHRSHFRAVTIAVFPSQLTSDPTVRTVQVRTPGVAEALGTQYFRVIVDDEAQEELENTNRLELPHSPRVTRVTGCTPCALVDDPGESASGTCDCPLQGSTAITVFGENFNNTVILVGGRRCALRDATARRFVCTLPPGSTGGSLLITPFNVVNGVPVFGSPVPFVSYARPSIVSLDGCANLREVPDGGNAVHGCQRSGGELLTVLGRNFGHSREPRMRVTVGGKACSRLAWADTVRPGMVANTTLQAVTCTLPLGSGEEVEVLVLDVSNRRGVGSGRLTFEPCAPGEYLESGSPACLRCPPGHFQSQGQYRPTFPPCQACPRGTFSGEFGASVCTSCDPGTFAPAPGLSACLNCTAGTYTDRPGSARCDDCAAGRFAARNSSRACEQCPHGRYGDDMGRTSCYQCPPGRFVDRLGALSCAGCPRGRWNGNYSRRVCDHCRPGTVANQTGASSCSTCAPGFYSSSSGAACLRCSSGSYSAHAGATSCTSCPVNTISVESASVRCTACLPLEFTSAEGQTSCSSCQSGRYARFVGNEMGPERKLLECAPCPRGASCHFGAAFAEKNEWIGQRPDGTIEAHQCLPQRCPGCTDAGSSPSVFLSSLKSSAVSCCTEHRVDAEANAMCGSCEEGYSEWGGKCRDCSRTNYALFVAFVLLLWAFVALMHFFVFPKTSPLSFVLIYFVQMTLLSFGEETAWLGWASVFDFNPLRNSAGGTCLSAWSPVTKLTVSALTPLLTVVLLLLTALLHALVLRTRSAPNWIDVVASYKRSVLALFLFTYNVLAVSSLQFVECVDVAGKFNVLRSAPEIDCDSPEYKRVRWIFYTGLALVCAGPPVLVWLLRRRSVRRAKEWLRGRSSREEDRVSTVVWGILFSVFKLDDYDSGVLPYYWNAVILARRIVLVGTSVFFTRYGYSERLGALTIAHLLTLLLHVHVRPFRDVELYSGAYVEPGRPKGATARVLRVNELETLSLTFLSALSVAASVVEPPFSSAQSIAFSTAVFTWTGVLALMLIWPKARAAVRWCRPREHETMDHMLLEREVRSLRGDSELQEMSTSLLGDGQWE